MGSRDLSRWTGQFLDPQWERAFRADAWPKICRQLRFMALLAASIYVAALWLNWKGLGGGPAFRAMTALRFATGLTLGAIAFASRPRWPQRRVHALILLTILLMVATRLVEGWLAPAALPAPPHPPAPVFPVLPLIMYAIIAIPAWLAMLWGAVGSLLFLRDQAAVFGLHAPATQVMLLHLLLANGVGYGFRTAWNRISRRDFALRADLEREVAERQRAEFEARRANAAKGRFLAVLSHEIRTPLNGLLGGAQLLREGRALPGQDRLLDMVSRSGNQLAMLVDDILDLARIEAGRLDLAPAPFCPAELLEDVHAVLGAQARARGLALVVSRPPGLPPCLVGDALRLRQVLINLAGNAVKFTDQGEVALTLSVEELPEGPARCTFAVRDTGPGLEPGAAARIFAPFEQGDMSTRRRHGGAGLGLAISRELVTAMGGELRLESAQGRGSTFSFTLALPRGVMPPPEMAPAAAGPLSLLVVDDLEANRIVAEGLLASLGHRTRQAAGGEEALAALQEEPFDAMLLDLHMEGMDGLEVLGRVRALPDPRLAALPVVLVTADAERTHLEACLEAGALAVLAKPLRKARLAEILANLRPGPLADPDPGPPEPPLVDQDQVAQILADLGPGAWLSGRRACRQSAGASLAQLAEPGGEAKALHRLVGLSASFALPRLNLAVRLAEAQVAAGEPFPPLTDLVAASLDALDAGAPGPP